MIFRTGRLLRWVVQASCARPIPTVVLSLGLASLALAYTLHALTFKTDSLDLLPPGQRYAALYREYSQDFGELDDIVVVVQGRTVEESKAYAARLVRELRTGPIRFHRLAYRIDPKQFEGRALLYLSAEELRDIRDKTFDHQKFMEAFAANPTLDQLIEGMGQQIARGLVSHFFSLESQDSGTSADLRSLREFLTQISARIDRPAPYRSPWGTLFSFDQAEEDSSYFFSEDKRLLFILADPYGGKGSFTNDRAAFEEMRRRIAELRPQFPAVQAGVTGPPALSNDEMITAFQDSQVATLLAFALTLGLLLVAFRRVGKPLLMLAVLAVSLVWSMGLITLTVGHLTLFSVMFISIVVGIGIDYGIYFLFRYEEELFLGRDLVGALGLTAERSGPGILLSALTAAATFYVLTLTEYRGIQELGFIAGTAILMACLAMLTLFPALLVLVDRPRYAARPRGAVPRTIEWERVGVPALERIVRAPKTVVAAAGLLTAFSLWAVRTVELDYNLLDLQAKGTESVVWQKKILATAKRSGYSALATAASLPELRRKQVAFERLPSVSEVDSVLRLIPDQQAEKIQIVQGFAPLVLPVRVGRPQSLSLDRLVAALQGLQRRLDLAVSEAGPEGPDREGQATRIQAYALLARLKAADREKVGPALNRLQAELSADFRETFQTFQKNLRPRPITPGEVPGELRRKFIGKSGRFLLQIHPKVNIWDRQGATRFIDELRSVDPDVTGTPVITYESLRLMEKAYRQGTAYAFLLVAALAAVMIRRLRETLLGLAPLLLGTLWAVGLMHVFDLKFNMANVWGLPLIIGASAEYGLSVVMRSLEARDHGGPPLARSTVMAVGVSGLTTIGGFGSLLVAHHQGIWSLGLLLTIGTCTSLLASLLVLPVLIRLAGRAAPATKDAPLNAA